MKPTVGRIVHVYETTQQGKQTGPYVGIIIWADLLQFRIKVRVFVPGSQDFEMMFLAAADPKEEISSRNVGHGSNNTNLSSTYNWAWPPKEIE